MLVETLVALTALGFIASSVFVVSILFVRYIQLSSVTHEVVKFANSPQFRNLPRDTNSNNNPAFNPIVQFSRDLLRAYREFPSRPGLVGVFYLSPDQINQAQITVERITVGDSSDIAVTARVGLEDLLGLRLFPLPGINIESRGPFLFDN